MRDATLAAVMWEARHALLFNADLAKPAKRIRVRTTRSGTQQP